MSIRTLLLLPLVSALVACSPPLKLNEGAANAKAEPAAKDDEAEEGDGADKTSEKKGDDKKSDKKGSKKKKAKGPFHWRDYAGPKVKTTITSKMVWAVVPVGLDGDFGVVKTAFLEYVKPEGDEHLVKVFGDDTVYVPQAMVQPATPAKNLKPGTALFVNVAAASGFGRVTEVIKGEAGALDRVKIKYEWAGQASDAELAADEVIVLEDKVAFGHPVSYPVGDGREVGTVVFTDAESTWVIGASGKVQKAATKDVIAMKTAKPAKPGYNCQAPAPFALKKGKVTAVLDGGVRYKFKPDAGGDEQTLSFHLVTIP